MWTAPCPVSVSDRKLSDKNGCGHGCGLSIGAWHVGVTIMVPETISKKLRPMCPQ